MNTCQIVKAGTSLKDLLSREVVESPTLLQTVGRAVAAGRAVAIANAFRVELAEAVATELLNSDSWAVDAFFDARRPYFQYRQQVILRMSLPPLVKQVGVALEAGESRALMSEITGIDCNGELRIGAARYGVGDYSFPHNDDGGFRCLTYIWYLCRPWQPDWGGHFVWCPSGTLLSPGFNMLVLFKVTRQSTHFVTPVAPHAAGNRLSINGWWERSEQAADGRPTGRELGGIQLCDGWHGSDGASEISPGTAVVTL